MTKKKRIGLILGKGDLAIYCMEQLSHLGYEIVVARLPCSQVKIMKNIDFIDVKYEEINEAFSFLKRKKIFEIALMGYIERPQIDALKATPASQKILLKVLPTLNKGDGTIFSAVKEMLVDQNFKLVKCQDLLPGLTLSTGRYGSPIAGEMILQEIKAGIKIFLKYTQLDIGQSLIFQNGHCLGMETITGTDEMIKNLIKYRKNNNNSPSEILSGGILIKGSKPDQVLDIDTPVVGPNTIKLAKKAKLAGLLIESNKVILENRDLIIDMLKSYKMFLFVTNFLNKDF